jgi:acetyl-CoA synthetase
VERALVDHPSVAEAAVCGRSDAQTSQAIVAYVTLKTGQDGTPQRLADLREHVASSDAGRRSRPAVPRLQAVHR